MQRDLPVAMRPSAEDIVIAALSSEAPSDMIALASRAGILKPTTGERCVLNSSVATTLLGGDRYRVPWSGAIVTRVHVISKCADGMVRSEVLAALAGLPGFSVGFSAVELDYSVDQVRCPDLPPVQFLNHAGVLTPNALSK